MATAQPLDFTNVVEQGPFNRLRQEPGDYKAKILKVEDKKSKENKPMWLFHIKVGSGTYPYYCTFDEKVLWKIRNLFVAAGIPVPRKKLKVDPEKVVGKFIGVTLEDDQYTNETTGKTRVNSTIASVIPVSELDDDDAADEEEDEAEETEDDDDGDEAPAPAKPTKTKTPAPAEDEDEDEMEDIDIDDL